jgi:hypothetical protein
VAILITDGESGPYDPAALAQTLAQPGQFEGNLGVSNRKPEAPVSLVVVRVGSGADRIYHSDGSVEAAFQPDRRSAEIVDALATATRGHAFDKSQLPAAGKALRLDFGAGPTTIQGVRTKTTAIAPYLAAAALALLAIVIWKRTLASL